MMYVHAMESISRAQSIGEGIGGLENTNFFGKRKASYPEFRDYFPAATQRRMSVAVRMGVACAKSVDIIGKPQAIIVGTGMGCIVPTIEFLNNIKHSPAVVSPTSFIQSTHNTVAGQIAINMENTGYNMTFSQGGFSFESALLDGMLTCEEVQTVLVGGVEEYSEAYEAIEGMSEYDISEGASFFLISDKAEGAMAKVLHVNHLACNPDEEEELINAFLKSIGIPSPQLTLKGHSVPVPHEAGKEDLYSDICGIYMSNAAFGLHLAIELLNSPAPEFRGKKWNSLESIAVVNRFNSHDCGLVIVSKP